MHDLEKLKGIKDILDTIKDKVNEIIDTTTNIGQVLTSNTVAPISNTAPVTPSDPVGEEFDNDTDEPNDRDIVDVDNDGIEDQTPEELKKYFHDLFGDLTDGLEKLWKSKK